MRKTLVNVAAVVVLGWIAIYEPQWYYNLFHWTALAFHNLVRLLPAHRG
jgi:hypothetical protein